MKITLHDPPEGFEAEAEFRVLMAGDKYMSPNNIGSGVHVWCDLPSSWFGIVLTPKKRKYWRLDPVATFEQASCFVTGHSGLRFGRVKYIGGFPEDYSQRVQWLRITECEE